MAKKDPKESRPLMLRRSQWDMLRELAKAHWTTWALSAAAAKKSHLAWQSLHDGHEHENLVTTPPAKAGGF